VLVEDELTREVLEVLWHDPTIALHDVGGRETVRAGVRASALFPGSTFGVLDRDFGRSNVAQWGAEGNREFVLDWHETENALLDFEVLCELADEPRIGPPELRRDALDWARLHLHWEACRHARDLLVRELRSTFPEDPRCVEMKAEDAARWLDEQCERIGAAGAQGREKAVGRLATFRRDFENALEPGDEWLRGVSGKELFRHLRSHNRGLDSSPQGSSAERDLTLAKRVARRMRELGRVPGDLDRLHGILVRTA